jgi:DNA-binding GntR family transcriptional regulator
MTKPLNLNVDRSAKTTLAEQIRRGIATAIESGVLEPGARLPSWQDLAAQLGVARGTVRTAYEKLDAAQLIVASRPTGTRVAPRPRAVVTARGFIEMKGALLLHQREVKAHRQFDHRGSLNGVSSSAREL